MKFLFIGCGSIGLRHIRLLKEILPDSEVIAYRTTSTNSEILEKLGVKTYKELNTALEEKPDAAFVTNPTSAHVETILKIKNKVETIFVEKPVSDSLEGVPEILEYDNTFLIGYILRYHPVISKVKELVDSGKIGRLIYAEASVGQYLPNWRPNVDYKESHSAKKTFGGGAILELSHEIDYLCWLMGEPTELFCNAGKFSDLEIEAEDIAEIILRFDENKLGRIHLDFLQRKASRTGKVIGTRGDIVFDIINGKIELNAESNEVFDFKTEMDSVYKTQLKHFIDVVKGKSNPRITMDNGLLTLRVAVAAKESSARNQVINMDEVKLK